MSPDALFNRTFLVRNPRTNQPMKLNLAGRHCHGSAEITLADGRTHYRRLFQLSDGSWLLIVRHSDPGERALDSTCWLTPEQVAEYEQNRCNFDLSRVKQEPLVESEPTPQPSHPSMVEVTAQPGPRTLEWLISTLRWYEELLAKQATYTNAALFNSVEAASRAETYRDVLRVSGEVAWAPGKGRLQLLCDEMDNADGLTAANAVKLRARVCRAKPCTLEEANALTLDEAADILGADMGTVENSATLPTTEIPNVINLNVLQSNLPMHAFHDWRKRYESWLEVPHLRVACARLFPAQPWNAATVELLIAWFQVERGLTSEQARHLPLSTAVKLLTAQQRPAEVPPLPNSPGAEQEAERGAVSATALPPSRLKALSQYTHAVETCPELRGATDQAVYDWLKEHSDGDPLPAFGTWARYLRDARQASDSNKHWPRKGRTGRSIVRPDEI